MVQLQLQENSFGCFDPICKVRISDIDQVNQKVRLSSSSNVGRKAPIRSFGRSLMKPTVSVTTTSWILPPSIEPGIEVSGSPYQALRISVFYKELTLRQPIEESDFPDSYIHNRDDWNPCFDPASPSLPPPYAQPVQVFFKEMNSFPHPPSINFKLCLTGPRPPMPPVKRERANVFFASLGRRYRS